MSSSGGKLIIALPSKGRLQGQTVQFLSACGFDVRRVGNGRDYDDVAPLKGVYQGAASSSLGVVVEMSRTH